MVDGGITPLFLNLTARWKWGVSFLPCPCNLQGKSSWYTLDGRHETPEPVWTLCRRKKSLAPTGNWPIDSSVT